MLWAVVLDIIKWSVQPVEGVKSVLEDKEWVFELLKDLPGVDPEANCIQVWCVLYSWFYILNSKHKFQLFYISMHWFFTNMAFNQAYPWSRFTWFVVFDEFVVNADVEDKIELVVHMQISQNALVAIIWDREQIYTKYIFWSHTVDSGFTNFFIRCKYGFYGC